MVSDLGIFNVLSVAGLQCLLQTVVLLSSFLDLLPQPLPLSVPVEAK